MSAVRDQGSLQRRSALDGHPLLQLGGDASAARVVIGLAPPRVLLQVSAFASRSGDDSGDDIAATAQRLSDILGMPLPGPNQMSGDASINVRAIGPGVWHVTGDESRFPTAAQFRQRLEGVATVVDLGHARAVFQVSGPDAARTIARHCGLDLDSRVFPNGSATGTRFNHLGMTLARVDRADTASYELSVFRGYAVFVFESLVESAREFGVAIG